MSQSLRERLFTPVSNASLVGFRVAFGLLMLWEVLGYFRHGWIASDWIEPAFHFTYPGFGWVKPWPGPGMYIHMGVLGILAAFITIGLFYRVSMALFCVGFTYIFLLEQALYLNHFYFLCLVSFLMIFVPAHGALSIDAWRNPRLRTSAAPSWSLWILRTQMAIVYLFGGIAKLNSDWFHGQPLGMWLAEKSTTPIVGPLFERSEFIHALAWGGFALDLFIVPLLVWRRTRAVAFFLVVSFHLLNAWFFQIGVFPWFSIAMTALFLEPDWPRRFAERVRAVLQRPRSSAERVSVTPTVHSQPRMSPSRQRLVVVLLGAYLMFQILVPFRHWLYPGDVAWTEEGHQFSWRMKLRDKAGAAVFVVTSPSANVAWFENPAEYLEPWQIKKMATRPELMRQFAHYLAQVKQAETGEAVEVRAQGAVQLNGHEPQALVDPRVDLAREPYRIGPASWVTRP